MSPIESSNGVSLIRFDVDDRWNRAAKSLCNNGGVAVVELSSDDGCLHQKGFELSRKAMDTSSSSSSSEWAIPPTADSAHATGYHPAGGVMSRYNLYREGFVFSDGQMIDGSDETFQCQMKAMFHSLHNVAQHVLTALEQEWRVSEQDWFQTTLGPTDNCSQWHVKRYVSMDETTSNTDASTSDSNSNSKTNGSSPSSSSQDWLPMHTDPSLISVVIHDAPSVSEGCRGLYYQTPDKRWIEIPHHGHSVAIVMVGSVLSYLTGGTVPAARHKVVAPSPQQTTPRMAATLFVRPQPTALLQAPPSPLFQTLKKQLTFETWNARVSRNYMKKKRKNEAKLPKQDERVQSETENPEASSVEFHYRDDYTELSLLPCNPPLTGREKFLGGELGANGKIYTIPGHAHQVVVIDCNFEPPTVAPIGPKFPGEFKWLRGVRMKESGIIYGIPCHADAVLRIDPSTDTVTTIEWDQNDPRAPPMGLPWKWHGGNVSPADGCLYCIPQFAEYVLKIDPKTEKASFLASDPLVGRNKWYGGLLGSDGAIYGVQQNAKGVLRIDPTVVPPTVTVHGDYPEGGHKWHGGVAGPDGCIYGIPAHADTVLKIVPGNPPTLSTIGDGAVIQTGQHRQDRKYKYLGGAVGHDKKIYFFPSDADFVLQIDPLNDTVRQVGPNLRALETIHHNKWQNGFTAPDGNIYGIPLKSGSILRIRPLQEDQEPEVTTIGGPYPGLNKWEGGVMSEAGDMYCMPLNHSMVLRMRPRDTSQLRD